MKKERVLQEIENSGGNVERSPLIIVLAKGEVEKICIKYLSSAILQKFPDHREIGKIFLMSCFGRLRHNDTFPRS
jgi:hypothetical protein